MTIANMGAELTLTTSIFPSDEVTRDYFRRLGREADWRPVAPDPDADYDAAIEVDLSTITPLIALPGSPDRVVPIEEVAGTAVEQVMAGSCTNGSWEDVWSVTQVVPGARAPVGLVRGLPGSHRILEVMAREGLVQDLLAPASSFPNPPAAPVRGSATCPRPAPAASARSTATSPAGAAPRTIRSTSAPRWSPRPRRSPAGSPTAGAAAAAGTRPPGGLSRVGRRLRAAGGARRAGRVVRGPNIKDVPLGEPVADRLAAPVPPEARRQDLHRSHLAGRSAALVFRSNVPAIAEFTFKYVDPEFVARAKAAGRGLLVAGELYGQGSSREAAAVAPMYLGVRAVLAKSFAPIHRANLINWASCP